MHSRKPLHNLLRSTSFARTVLGLLKYWRVHSAPCAPAARNLSSLATVLQRFPNKHRQNGFTLIELLVVMAIAGVLVALASLSMGVLGRNPEIEDQARRLYAVMAEAHEEAEMQGKDLGLLIERDGYLFMRFDYGKHRWLELTGDDLTAHRQLPEGLQIRLWLEGREVIVKTHNENQALLARSSSSASSADVLTGPTSHSSQQDAAPQVFLLSSGELSPFELHIEREGIDFAWKLTGKADNTVDIEPAGAT